jgi:hypothetical protein
MLAPVLAGSTAAVAAAVLYNRARSRKPSANTRPSAGFSTWTACAFTTSSVGRTSPGAHPRQWDHDPGFHGQRSRDKLASHYRVIVFDRPGYSHSSRPRQL